MPFKSEKQRKWMHATKPKMAKKWEKEKKDEAADRDYKDEYKKFQSSDKSKKYRAELNKYNRKKGTYGNGDGKDASHKGGKIAGFEAESKNRGRAEKSRLKKESPDFNPMIDMILDDVIDEYQTTNEKVLKKNPGEFVDAKFSKAIDKLPNSKLTKDLVIKLAKKYKVDQDDALRFVSYGYLRDFGLKESVNEGKFGKFDTGAAFKGNGMTIYDRNQSQGGDFKNIAHIGNDGKLTIWDKNIKKEAKLMQSLKKISQEFKTSFKESVNEGKLSEDYKNSEWEVYVADEKGKEKIVKKAKSKRAGVILYNKLINSGLMYYEVGMRVVKESVNESVNEGVSKSQAQEIMRQLGGRKFEMLMGVKSKSVGTDGLILHIGKNPKKVSHIIIDLNRDEYDLTFGKVFKYNWKVIKKVKGVGVEQLHDMIEKYTGNLTTFRPRK